MPKYMPVVLGIAVALGVGTAATVAADSPQSTPPSQTEPETNGPQVTATVAADSPQSTSPSQTKPETNVPQVTLQAVKVEAKSQVQNLQTIPVSVAVMDSSQMSSLGVENLRDISQYFSDVTIDSGPLNGGVYIRGVGNSSAIVGLDNRVGVYLDGVYIGQSPALNQDTLGISQVEVFRGPQGTLFGQNTIAGVINIITEKPSEVPDNDVSIRVGNYGLFDEQLHLSGPLADGIYGGLFLGDQLRDGYVKDVFNNTTQENLNRKSFRGQLEIDRFENWKIYATLDGTKSSSREGSGIPITNTIGTAPYSETSGFFNMTDNRTPPNAASNYGTSVRADYNFPNGLVLISTSSYRNTLFSDTVDADYSMFDLLYTHYQYRYKQFTQELQLMSPKDSALQYVFGASYYGLDSFSERDAIVGINGGPFIGAPAGSVVPTRGTVRTTTGAIYGNATYNLSSNWVLQGGVRVSEDQKTGYYFINGSVAPAFALATGVFNGVIKNNEVTPSVTLTRELGPDNRIYARFAQGYKDGGFNTDFVAANIFPDNITVKPEYVNDYELGFKSTINDRVRVNASVFDEYFRGYQLDRYIQSGNSTLITLTNAGKVRSRGLEVDGSAVLMPGLRLETSLAYLDTVFTDYPNANLEGANFKGHRLPFASKFQGSVGINYSSRLGSGYYGELSIRDSYRTGYYSDVNNLTTVTLASGDVLRYDYVGAFGLLDGSYTVTPSIGNWTASLWAQNLLNKRYVTSYGYDFFGTLYNAVGQPRTFGVRATLHF
jgi:iron complex outermembrane receptor protein